MGLCFGSQTDEQTRIFDRQLRANRNKDNDLIKLLFLGAGGSGKSTLFKQLRLIHGQGLQDEERGLYRKNVHANVIEGLKLLSETLLSGSLQEEDADERKAESKLIDLGGLLADYEDTYVTPKIVESMQEFWALPSVKALWQDRAKLQIQDSLEYFMKELPRIAETSYIPSTSDCLHVRARTTGIVEETFTIKNRNFLIVDVGGQRSERKKWINCFDGVTGIIYVVSLSGYDQYLFEDESTYRMTESLKVFRDLNNEHLETFKEASMILFLNKSDLFYEKIKLGQGIKTCFPHYSGSNTDEDASYNYIKNQFLEARNGGLKKHNVDQIKIFVHKTCATDTNQMKHIFDAVNHTIINRALIKAGLLVQ